MKINLALVLAIIVAVGLVALGFTAFQISSERETLTSELQARTVRNGDEFYRLHLDSLALRDSVLQDRADSLARAYSFSGILLYHTGDSVLPLTRSVPALTATDQIGRALSADSSLTRLTDGGGRPLFEYVKVVRRDSLPPIAIAYYTDATYIDHIINSIWARNFLRWFIQALLISVITLLIVRRGVLLPVNRVIAWVRAARQGNVQELQQTPPGSFLSPLYQEITGIARAMHEAQAQAREEARLRTTAEAVWTPERLNEEMRHLLRDRKLIVVSNREPYMHIRQGKEIQCIMPASGMVTALEPILKACGGLWIASGSGDADRETVDAHDKVLVPPGEGKYTLRRIWITKEQEQHFYYGFSNEGLWPLCHIAHTRPVFRTEDWEHYCAVNEQYADAVLQEIENEVEPFILVQDYHFALLPRLIKEKRPDARVAIFWHIPWPNPESFGICPWQKELLLGMLGADLVGFHTQYHCNNFLETVNGSLESRVIWEHFAVKIGNRLTQVKPFPISIAFTLKDLEAAPAQERPAASELLRQHGISAECFGIGVDRIDYTKGLTEKFLAVERFFAQHPEYIGRFTFVQIGAPSRSLLKSYSDTISAVDAEAERINFKLKAKGWQPILLLKKHHSHEEILPFYQQAKFCMVTSLHDGMNLVAKEFIATRQHNDGVLILSQFAGAAHDLHGALVINPYDTEGSAAAIHEALEMPAAQQEQQMTGLRRTVMRKNVYAWAADILKSMAAING